MVVITTLNMTIVQTQVPVQQHLTRQAMGLVDIAGVCVQIITVVKLLVTPAITVETLLKTLVLIPS
jgi:hypothetical protein